MSTSIMSDGGLHIAAKAGLDALDGIRWRTAIPADVDEGDTLTLSLAAGDAFASGLYDNLKIRDSSGIMLCQVSTASATPKTFKLPHGAAVFEFIVFAEKKLEEDVESLLHPQLEKGSSRTCWEPPENLRVGGSLRDLNLAGAWPATAPSWMKMDFWQADGHTAHATRSETMTTWASIDTAKVTLPAGTYSVRCDGLASGIACEFRDVEANKLLGYVSGDWRTITFTEPTTVIHRFVISPNWSGDATVTSVILEGDWGGWGRALS